MLRTLRRSCLWNASIFLSRVSVRVHNSQLYKKILANNALNILILVSTPTCLLVNIGFSFEKAVLVSCLRRSMSSVVPRRLPTYLHFFQLSSPPFLCDIFQFLIDLYVGFPVSVLLWWFFLCCLKHVER